MDFEEQIKLLAKAIYEKVVKFIYNNHGEDEKFYEYEYLNLSDGVQAMFDFSNSYLYIIKEDEEGFNAVLGYKIKIINDDTEYRHNRKMYQTFLNEKIARSQMDGQRRSLEIELAEQQNLTEKEKEDIKKYYEQINKAIDSISYNKEKTHTIRNFNSEMFDVYNEFMYEKEMKKMENMHDKVLPTVRVAVDWWTEMLYSKTRNGSIENDDNKTMSIFSDMLYPVESIPSEKIAEFKKILAEKIMSTIYEYYGETIEMECDYGPHYLLYEAMQEVGIRAIRIPYKTEMDISAYKVAVKEGYGAKYMTLFDSTEESDVEIAKDIYCKINQIESPNQSQKVFQKC